VKEMRGREGSHHKYKNENGKKGLSFAESI
jgi:hypothetical protein